MQTTPVSNTTNSSKDIEATLAQFTQALEDHDVEKIISYYAPGAVMYTLPPPLEGQAESKEA